MAKRTVSAYVICPYYKSHERRVIYCEGVEENSSTHVAFGSDNQFKEYQDIYCKNCWKKCMIADALNRMWGADE